MGKGGTTIQAPDPINAGEAQGEYLFGPGFRNFRGVTDPRLVGRIVESEARFRPEFTALELADIGTFARGTERRTNPAYEEARREDAGFKSILKKLRAAGGDSTSAEFQNSLGAGERFYLNSIGLLGEEEDGSPRRFSTIDIERQVQRTEGQLKDTPQTLERQEGLFDLLEESSERAFDLQSQQLGQQREADVAALQRFARPVVEAYRAADPFSTRLAERASERAGQETGIGRLGEFLMGTARQRTKDPSALEFQLAQIGLERGDLSPTEQEALISGRGTEFIQSTGELSPLEQRRVQQSARQASLARGRELGQGALAEEIANRFAEESGKREREIALGAQLLGQEAGLRGARLGQGAGILTQAEALAAQRRAEELQRFQLGAGLVGQEEGIQSGRFGQAFGMNRALAGDAGNIILGRPSAAIGLGQQTLGQAQAGAAGPMGPQLFDPNVGINMALQTNRTSSDYLARRHRLMQHVVQVDLEHLVVY